MTSNANAAYIYDAVRTPRGKGKTGSEKATENSWPWKMVAVALSNSLANLLTLMTVIVN